MIPRKLHFFWDCRPLSYLRFASLLTARRHHPDWEINLWWHDTSSSRETWTTTELLDLPPAADYLPRVAELGVNYRPLTELFTPPVRMGSVQISDLFAYRVLADVGGFAADTDFVFIRPLDPLIAEIGDKPVGLTVFTDIRYLAPGQTEYFPVGLMVGRSEEFYGAAFRLGLQAWNPAVYESCGSPVLTATIKSMPDLIYWLSVKAFYNYQNMMSFEEMLVAILERDRRDLISPHAYAIHWNGAYDGSKKLSAEITEQNIGQYGNTICKLISEGLV